MKLKIDVTQEDIDEGKADKVDKCPIALSLRRLNKAWEDWYVMYDLIYSLDDVPSIPLPKKAQSFITRFDHGRKGVKPFSFTITVPYRGFPSPKGEN